MQFLITGYDRAKREITGSGELIQFLITGYDRLIWTSPCSLVIFCMKILNGLKAIKEYQVSILIAFIIVSILYGIHMFRYEYIDISHDQGPIRNTKVLRVDRITNDVCLYAYSSLFRRDVNNDITTGKKEKLDPNSTNPNASFLIIKPCD